VYVSLAFEIRFGPLASSLVIVIAHVASADDCNLIRSKIYESGGQIKLTCSNSFPIFIGVTEDKKAMTAGEH